MFLRFVQRLVLRIHHKSTFINGQVHFNYFFLSKPTQFVRKCPLTMTTSMDWLVQYFLLQINTSSALKMWFGRKRGSLQGASKHKKPSKYFPRERRVYKVSHNSWFLSVRRQLQKWEPKQIQTKRSENPRGAAAGPGSHASWRPDPGPDPGLRQRGGTFKWYTIWSKKYRLLNKTDIVTFYIINNVYDYGIWRTQQVYMYSA